MKTLRMWSAAGAALVSIVGLGAPIAAQASAEGSRNTAIALGAAAIYALVNHKTAAAVVLGAGAAVAAKQSDDQRHRDNERDCYRRDDNGNYSGDNCNSHGGYDRNDYGARGDYDRNDHRYGDGGDRAGNGYTHDDHNRDGAWNGGDGHDHQGPSFWAPRPNAR